MPSVHMDVYYNARWHISLNSAIKLQFFIIKKEFDKRKYLHLNYLHLFMHEVIPFERESNFKK